MRQYPAGDFSLTVNPRWPDARLCGNRQSRQHLHEHKKGVFVFSPEGKVIQEYLGEKYSNIHDMKIREEDDSEFIYGARNVDAEGIKFNAHGGEIVLKLPFPKESGLDLKKFNPTAITVAPNGDIFLSDGYASNHIFKIDKTGKYLMHFGKKSDEL